MKLVQSDLDVDPGTNMAANYTSHLVQLDVRKHPEIVDLNEQLAAEDEPAKRQELSNKISAKQKRVVSDTFTRSTKPNPQKNEKPGSTDLGSRIVRDHHERTSRLSRSEGRPLRFFQRITPPPPPRSKIRSKRNRDSFFESTTTRAAL
ncbi:MAG: hypothetical protein R3C11_08990 [Planctomycetaceae bacterium]